MKAWKRWISEQWYLGIQMLEMNGFSTIYQRYRWLFSILIVQIVTLALHLDNLLLTFSFCFDVSEKTVGISWEDEPFYWE